MVKVVCDAHRPMKYSWTRAGSGGENKFRECEKEECQAVLAARRLEVEAAGAPTEEQKAVWRAQLPGRAMAKAASTGGKA